MGVWSGSCHCGAVRFRVAAEIDELTRCDCSLCRRKGALMAKVHESALTIEAGEDQLTLYQWNTKVARHWFCARIASRKYRSAARPGRPICACARRAMSAKIAFSAAAWPSKVASALARTFLRACATCARIAS